MGRFGDGGVSNFFCGEGLLAKVRLGWGLKYCLASSAIITVGVIGGGFFMFALIAAFTFFMTSNNNMLLGFGLILFLSYLGLERTELSSSY